MRAFMPVLCALLVGCSVADRTRTGAENRPAIQAPGSSGRELYVSPTGNSDGDGSVSNPWSLAKALSASSGVKPGDMIWLGGGTYSGSFTSELSGTADAPIVVKQRPGERAIVDNGADSLSATLTVKGSNTWFWGFEVMNSNQSRVVGESGSSGGGRGVGVDIYGPGTKLINMAVHDSGGGVSLWSSAPESEIYGTLIYDNGWDAPDRGHGHGIYSQNRQGKMLLTDNLIFNQFGEGINIYGTWSAGLNNFDLEGNTVFDNGVLSARTGFKENVLLGGDSHALNPTLVSNYTYSPEWNGGNNLGYHEGCFNLVARDNYFAAPLADINCVPSAFSGNTIFGGILPVSAPSTATWSFTGLRPGTYRVSVNYIPYYNHATNAPFTVLDGGATSLGTVLVNQQATPADFNEAGVAWKDLGYFTISSGSLSVILSNTANDYVSADAVRVQASGQAPVIQDDSGPSFVTTGNWTAYEEETPPAFAGYVYGAGNHFAQANNTWVSTFPGNVYPSATPSDVRVFVRPNRYEPGRANLTVFNWAQSATVDVDVSNVLSIGASFEVRDAQNFFGAPVLSGKYEGGKLRLPLELTSVASPIGNVPVPVTHTRREFNAFVLLPGSAGATVTPPPSPSSTPVILDDGEAGFSVSGNWIDYSPQGFRDDVHYSASGNGSSVASWTFTGLAPGLYRVSATWSPYSNRATNAPFTVLDGNQALATVTVNQQLAPADLSEAGVGWKDLGTSFTVSSGTLVVRLSNSANQYVIADAIRIQRIGDLPASSPLPSTPVILDDGEAGFSVSGNWIAFSPQGFRDDVHYSASGNGSSVASWTFTGLAPGLYRVSATWSPYSNRATNAPFTVLDGNQALATVTVNQQLAPADLSEAGVGWKDLGTSFSVSSGTLVVRLSNSANQYVIADAIRVQKVAETPEP